MAISYNESMVSFASRRYMRVVNGSLVVCLSEYLPCDKTLFCEETTIRHSCFLKIMFRPTRCPAGKQYSNHEINCLAYLNRKTKCRNYL